MRHPIAPLCKISGDLQFNPTKKKTKQKKHKTKSLVFTSGFFQDKNWYLNKLQMQTNIHAI